MIRAATRYVRHRFAGQFLPAFAVVAILIVAPALAQENDERTVQDLFEDYLHFARMGKFVEADAFAAQLLDHPDLDPVKLLAIADRDRQAVATLSLIISNSSAGENAKRVLELLREGEFGVRKDVSRIQENIQKLGGTPQMEFDATKRLIESGEYSVPWVVQALRDESLAKLHPRILVAAAKLGRSGVGPLSIALATDNADLRGKIVRILGDMGYWQAIPYLQRIVVDETSNADTKAAAQAAIARIVGATRRPVPQSPSDSFLALAQAFYDEEGSVAADPRLDSANVWYWNAESQALVPTKVPSEIFGPVMAMRTSNDALKLQPDKDAAIALWLAANIRREFRLGFDVESPEPSDQSDLDATRPEQFPPSLYFTRAAGARYAHLVLQRAVEDRDAAVALGAIAALKSVAGQASLIGSEDIKQPLAQALQFPDRVVRIQAALALAEALPRSQFLGAQWVVPSLASALEQSVPQANYIVVVPDRTLLNETVTALRDGAGQIVAETNFYKAMDRARAELESISGFILAENIAAPDARTAVADLQRDYALSRIPVVILDRSGKSRLSADINLPHVGQVDSADELLSALGDVRERSGQTQLNEQKSLDMALAAADALGNIARDHGTVFSAAEAESALVAAHRRPEADESLRIACAEVLGLIGSPSAQMALVQSALDDSNSDTLRTAAFDSLATAAKSNGNGLNEDQTAKLVTLTRDEPNLALRTAASMALGALNLSDNQASEIIRSYHGG